MKHQILEINIFINQVFFPIILSVLRVGSYISHERPVITIGPQNASILANEQIFFICISEGNPKPKVLWMFNKKLKLPDRYNIIKDSVLQLSSAISEDNGAMISCICRNVMGSDERHAYIRIYNAINVVPKGFPKYLGKSSIIVSQKNSNVTLECSVIGQPLLNIIWFKNYYPLNFKKNRYKLKNGKNLLIIKAIESDTGKYHCMAINRFGSIISPPKSLMIRVSRFSPHFVYVSPDQSIRTGSSVTLNCTGEGNPTPTVYWICGNTKLTGHGIGSDSTQQELVGSINMILSDISESLNCTCVAKTNREIANHTVHITVKNLPMAPKIVRISSVTSRSCLLTWKYQSTSGVSISSFSVFYIPTIKLRIDQPFSKTIDISAKEIQGSDFEINTKISDLRPYMNYSMWLVTNGMEGVSEPSGIHSFKTREAKPSSAPKSISISLLSETSVRIKWKPPIEANGKIRLYRIFYSKRKTAPLPQWSISEFKTVSDNPDGDNFLDILMLDRNKEYFFCITSENDVGEGPVSEKFSKFINDAEIYQLNNLTLLSTLSTSVAVSWQMNPVSKVNYFKIVCLPFGRQRFQSENNNKLFINKKNKQSIYFTTLSNLLPDTMYVLEIFPVVNEEIKTSTKLDFKTHYHDNNEDVKTVSLSQQSIDIYISRNLQFTTSKLEVQYYPYGHINKLKSQTCIIKSESKCKINNLEPETLYQLDIKYRGENIKRFVETWSKAPKKIQDLRLEVISVYSQSSIRASWNYTESNLPVFEVNYYPVNVPKGLKSNKYAKSYNVTGLKFETDPQSHVMGSTVEFSIKTIMNFQISEPVYAKITLPEGIPTTYPKNLTAFIKFNENFLLLKWDPLEWEYLNGNLKANEISCNTYQSVTPTFKKNITENEVHISKDVINDKTQCRVRCRTKIGAGPWSPFVYINYMYSTIEPPTQVNVIMTVPYCLKITWKWKKEFLHSYSYFLIQITTEDGGNVKTVQRRTKYASSLYYENHLTKFNNASVVMQSIMSNGMHSEFSKKEYAKPYSTSWPVVNVISPICLSVNSRKIKLKWTYHYKIENLSHFRINFTGITQFKSRYGNEITMVREEREYSAIFNSPFVEYETEIHHVLPNTQNYFDIEPIQVPGVDAYSEFRSVRCSTLSEPPKDVPELKIGKVDKANSVVYLAVNQPSFEYGSISIYFIVVDANYLITRVARQYNISEDIEIYRSRDMILNFLARTNRSRLSKQQIPYIAAELNATSVMKESMHGQVFMFPLGSKQTASLYPYNRPLVKGIDYRAVLVACISSIFNESSIKSVCTMSQWSSNLNPLKADSNYTTTTLVFSELILASILIPLIIVIVLFLIILILKRRNINLEILPSCLKFRNTAANYYPASNSEIKENLVNPLISSTNAGSSYFYQNHDSVELKRYQISTTPDLLVQSSPSISYKETKLKVNKENFQQFQHKVPIGLLQEYISNLKANDNRGFSLEFESIDHANQFSWEQSNKPSNKSKNRYANVVAYDHSRVVLQSCKSVNDVGNSLDPYKSTDYINANYINGYRRQNAYIATQGPLLETISDFWRMVWEQRSIVIVMVTLLKERSRTKCEQYWPKSNRGSQCTYGGIVIILNSVQQYAYFICRSLIIQKIGSTEKREIKHYQFTAWPDHGVPHCTIPFLIFVNRIKKEVPLDSGPLVVHCSAGVGRTGVFITVDAMLEQLKHEKSVDIYSYVTHIRSQRNYMVQTEEQYIFIHDVLLDYYLSVNTEITSLQLYSHVEKLNRVEYEKAGLLQFTGFQLEYRRLLRWSSLFSYITPSTKSECSTKSSDSIGCQLDFSINNYETASLLVNQSKNRSPYSLPPDINRVILCPIRGVEGSDYINASWIDGFKSRKAYIATQCPIKETTEDFWRMLWEHDCGMVVTLNFVAECSQYWPKDRSARYQFFVVDPIVEYQMPHFVMREFKLTDARDGQSRVMRQFQFTNWIDESCVPVSVEQLLELINQIQKTKEQFGQNGPLTVHCNSGSTRTGIFIILSILLEKLKVDNAVNIFESFKLLKCQRPSMIDSEEQYQFCFTALLEYLTLYSDENTTL